MSDVETLREFGRFQAAGAWQFGSATDITDTDFAIPGEASTDPHTTRRLLEQRLLPLSLDLLVAELRARTAVSISDLTSNETPSSAVEVQERTPKEQIRQQVRALRGGSRLLYRERLARRLEFLLGALEEEGEPLAEDSPESLRHMLLFLEALPEFRYPTITVTPFATFRAQWRSDPTRHFAVDFLPDGQVRFVVFAPDPSHPARVQRVSGIVSCDNAVDAIETYKVHRWAGDAGT